MKSRLIAAMICTTILGYLALPVAWALVQISNLRMSTTSNGAAVTEFASGTQEVFIVFDYSGANNEKIEVEVRDWMGNRLFVSSETYNGSGTRSISITGEKVFDSYKNAASTQGQEMLNQIQIAQGRTNPSFAQIDLSNAIARGEEVKGVVSVLRSYPTSADIVAQLEEAARLLNQAVEKGQQLIDVRQTPSDQRIARISEMMTPAQEAVSTLEAALARLGSGQGRALPAGPDSKSYNTTVSVKEPEDSLAANVEWTVAPSATPTPSATSTATPAGAIQASATPTSLPGQPTANATPTSASGQTTTSPTPLSPQPSATRQPHLTPLAPRPVLTLPPTTQRPSAPLVARPSPTGGVPAATSAAPVGVATTASTKAPGASASPTAKAGTPVPSSVAGAKDTSGLPFGMIGLVGGALLLGILALWVRNKF